MVHAALLRRLAARPRLLRRLICTANSRKLAQRCSSPAVAIAMARLSRRSCTSRRSDPSTAPARLLHPTEAGRRRRHLSPQLVSTPPSALTRMPLPNIGTAASSISRSTMAATPSASASSHSTSTSSWTQAMRKALGGSWW